MAGHNIRVDCICLNPTETALSKRLRETDPEEIVAVAFLASDDASFVGVVYL